MVKHLVETLKQFGPLPKLSQQGVEKSHSIYKTIIRTSTSNGTNKGQIQQYLEKILRIFIYEKGVKVDLKNK